MTEPKPPVVDIDGLERELRLGIGAAENADGALFAEAIITANRRVLALIAEVRELRGASRWIACSERMPTTGLSVLVLAGMAYFDGIDWRTLMGASHRKIEWAVTHWMPLPSPPEESP